MSIDRVMFADKLRRYRQQLQVSIEELASSTGIAVVRLNALEDQFVDPSGGEVLILADFFKCDYRFFVSNEVLAPFEQTEALFRRHGDELTKSDRWAIQEFLFLCECEHFLSSSTSSQSTKHFGFTKRGKYFKGHGVDAAQALRTHLEYGDQEVPRDVFRDLRAIGIHVFRRRLGRSSISGLFVRHPIAGLCVLINFTEDRFRQRFTAVHEAAHAILDDDHDFVLTHSDWDRHDLSEVRANTFASHYLLPRTLLETLKLPERWSQSIAIDWALRLMVNVDTLAFALKDAGLVDDEAVEAIRSARIGSLQKDDPELSPSLTDAQRQRKVELMERGLSGYYVTLCFEAYESGLITAGRLCEVLLTDERELPQIAALFGAALAYGS